MQIPACLPPSLFPSIQIIFTFFDELIFFIDFFVKIFAGKFFLLFLQNNPLTFRYNHYNSHSDEAYIIHFLPVRKFIPKRMQ